MRICKFFCIFTLLVVGTVALWLVWRTHSPPSVVRVEQNLLQIQSAPRAPETVPVARKKAFVTGGRGFLAQHVIDQLVDAKWDVTTLVRASSNTDELRKRHGNAVRIVHGDLRDIESLRKGIDEDTAVVFHIAALAGAWFGFAVRILH